MARPKLAPKTRLNLEMSEESRRKLEYLRKATNADSLTEVIRKALAVYEFLWRQKASNGRLVVQTDDSEKELVLM
jgi:hypothetical protein